MNDLTPAEVSALLFADAAFPSAAPVIPAPDLTDVQREINELFEELVAKPMRALRNRPTCSECDGSGYDWTDIRHGQRDCPRCAGSGMEPRT